MANRVDYLPHETWLHKGDSCAEGAGKYHCAQKGLLNQNVLKQFFQASSVIYPCLIAHD